MICPNCKQRWAPFDSRDFTFNPQFGFKPAHDKAEKWRMVVWEANNEELCPECKVEMDKAYPYTSPY